MTVNQLKKILKKIPPIGAINKARRAAIVEQINRMTVGV